MVWREIKKFWKYIVSLIGILGLVKLVFIGIAYFSPTDAEYMPVLSSAGDETKNVIDVKMAQESAERDKQNGRKFLNYSIAGDLNPVVFWDGQSSKKMLTIKNDSDIIFSSKKVDGSAYEINLKLKIAFFDDSGNQIGNDYFEDLRQEIPPNGGSIYQEIPFSHAQEHSGTIDVSLVCKDKGGICDTSNGKRFVVNFSQGTIKNLKIIVVDATFKEGDNIEISNFRTNFYNEFGLSEEDGDLILKALYTDNAVQEKELSGAIILGNPSKYPGDNHILIQRVKKLILNSYTHISSVIFLGYDSGNFKDKTYLFSNCSKNKTCPNTVFAKLDTFKNPFGSEIFEANPDLDLFIVIPAASEVKKSN